MSPSKAQARKMVLVSAFLLALLAAVRPVTSGSSADTKFRRLWGVGVVSLFLSILADFAPTVAGPFGVLAVLGSLTGKDRAVLDSLLARSASVVPAPTAPSAPVPVVPGP